MVTNQVVANPGASMGGPALSPIGGNIMAHSSTTRLHLRKSSANTRVAKLVCSPNMPEADAKFSIGEAGIDDVTD